MKTLVKKFCEITATDVDSAGGKGANLGAMFTHTIPVPDGFVILTSCYDQFLQVAGLDTRIASLLKSLDVGDTDDLSSASEQIAGRIRQEEIQEEIARSIYSAFDQLQAPLVAVRSSANAEDRADSAWAGQLDTYLGTTRATLIPNIKKCWASLFTPRALTYRFQNNLMTSDISVAVVVQEMVASEVAGVAFSVHPVTQDPDQMIIEAGFGLGEAVVSGAITPDSYIIRKSDRQILETYPSRQLKGVFLTTDGGTTWMDLPASQSDTFKLNPWEIRELADLVIRIEAFFSYPCDIEWARKDGKWYILQCRPITTLGS
ncbi:MAG: PEP/pyruvate-binding domain-containing protein [bacterium]